MYCVQPSISIISHAPTAQPPTKTMRFSSGICCGWGRNTSWFAARCPQRRPWFRPVSLPPPSATSPVKPWPKDAKPLSFCRWLPECAFMCPWRVRDNYCSHPRTRNSNRSMKQGWKLDPNPWSIQVRQAAPWIRCAPSGANGPRTWHQPCELQRPGVFQWWFIGFECDFHEL